MTNLLEILATAVPYVALGEVTFESSERNSTREHTEVRSVTNSQGLVRTSDFFDNTRTSADTKGYKIVRPGMFVYNPSRINVGSIGWLEESEPVIVSPMYVVFALDTSRLIPEYLSLFLSSNKGRNQIEGKTEVGARFRLTYSALSTIRIPLPAVEIQREIAGVLDRFTDLNSELNAELEARRLQFAFYRDSLLTGAGIEGTRSTTLGELYETSSGLSKSADEFGFGQPFLSFKTVFNSPVVPRELPNLVNSTAAEQARYSIRAGDVFVTRTSEDLEGLAMSCAALRDYPKATFNGFTKRLRPKTNDVIDAQFAAYFFRSAVFRGQIARMAIMSTRVSLNDGILLRVRIPVPPMKDQRRIVGILEKLDSLVNDSFVGLPAELNARRQQYDFYRDKVLSFEEAVA